MSAVNLTSIQTPMDFLKTLSTGITKNAEVKNQEVLFKTCYQKKFYTLVGMIVTVAVAVLLGIFFSPFYAIPLGVVFIFPLRKWIRFAKEFDKTKAEFDNVVQKNAENFRKAATYINQKREEKERYLIFHFNSKDGSTEFKSPSEKLNDFEKSYDASNKDIRELVIRIDNLKLDLSWLPKPTQENFTTACKRYIKPKQSEDHYIDISAQISKAHSVYESFNY